MHLLIGNTNTILPFPSLNSRQFVLLQHVHVLGSPKHGLVGFVLPPLTGPVLM